MSSTALRLAQWLPTEPPDVGDSITVTDDDPLRTQFATAAFPEAPIDGSNYGRQDAGWSPIIIPPPVIAADAPNDGRPYSRQSRGWVISPNPIGTDAPVDGKQYARKDAAWSAVPVDPIPTDAPADAKQYARKNNAWAEVVIPPSGIPEAPTDGKQYARQSAAWAAVLPANAITVDDVAPASPKVGDRWVRPADGQDATFVPIQAGGGAWMDTDSVVMAGAMPLAINLGGTGATDAPTALANLGIPLHDKLVMETYPTGLVARLESNVTPGDAVFRLVKKGVAVNAINAYKEGATAAGIRWQIVMGDAGAESGSNAGSDFRIQGYSDAGAAAPTAMVVSRATGQTTFGARINIQSSVYALWQDQPANFSYLQHSPGWTWRFNHVNGELNWIRNNGATATFALKADGGLDNAGNSLRMGGDLATGLWVNNNERYVQLYQGYRFQLAMGSGIVYLIANEATKCEWRLDGTYVIAGQGYKPGGGAWADSSDRRIKDRIEDYMSGLDEVLRLRPRRFHFKAATGRDTTKEYIGLVAQEAEEAMPELVETLADKLGDIELSDMRRLDSSAITYALVNAVKELAQRLDEATARIAVLEGA